MAARRTLLLGALAAPVLNACAPLPAMQATRATLAELESDVGGRLGVMGIDTGTGRRIQHRADERFAFCSTFKVLAASAVLRQSVTEPGLLQRRVRYARQDLVTYSPITEKHVNDGMTLGELCAAALQYSDNTAGNLLARQAGGLEAVTAFARSLGDQTFRMDRWETALNTAVPGDPRDTCTPGDMARNLQRLALDDALPLAQRNQLQAWMRDNTTGGQRIRAASGNWMVADKTGSGDYGTTNDIGVVWPVARAPLVLAIYYTQDRKDATMRNEVVASAARIAIRMLTA